MMKTFILLVLLAFANCQTLEQVIQEKEADVKAIAASAETSWSQRCLLTNCNTCSNNQCTDDPPSSTQCMTDFGALNSCTCPGRNIDVNSVVHIVNSKIRGSTGLDEKQKYAVCSLKKMEPDFVRLYKASVNVPSWRYFGHSTGVHINHPNRVGSSGLCSSYDPRKRPWYIAASSGPKDVIIVIDISGSMLNFNRFNIAKDATLAVLDTLTYVDWFNIIVFSNVATSFDTVLIQGNERNINRAKAFMNNIVVKGGTNFEIGFKKAFDIIKESDKHEFASGCTNARMMLFLTDGIVTLGKPADEIHHFVSQLNSELKEKIRIMAFSLGRESDRIVPRNISCSNNGVWKFINDGGDLISQMSTYFETIALGTDREVVSWTEPYIDAFGMGEMVTAAVTAYETTPFGKKIIGVAGIDVTLKELEKYAQRDQILQNLASTSKRCSPIVINECQLKELRGPEGSCEHNANLNCVTNHDTPSSCTNPISGSVECSTETLTDVKRNELQCCTNCTRSNPGSNANSSSDDDKKSLIGGVIGGVAAVVLLFGLCYCCRNKKNTNINNNQPVQTYQNAPPQGNYNNYSQPTGAPPPYNNSNQQIGYNKPGGMYPNTVSY